MGLDPAVNDGALDTDSDGLSNLEEYQRGTQANQVDSDGDTLSDADELHGSTGRIPTDPLLPDTDGDGVNDRADADPRDVTTDTLARAQGEPVIRLETCAIALSTDRHQVENSAGFVGVENAGTSSLAWTVEGTNLSSALRVLPLAPSVIQGPSKSRCWRWGRWTARWSCGSRTSREMCGIDSACWSTSIQPLPPDPCTGVPSIDGGVVPGVDGSVASDAGDHHARRQRGSRTGARAVHDGGLRFGLRLQHRNGLREPGAAGRPRWGDAGPAPATSIARYRFI